MAKSNRALFQRRKMRVRKALKKVAYGRPRLSVFRSGKNISAQIIDDRESKTLVSASTLEADVRGSLPHGGNQAAAEQVGKAIAERAAKAGISEVIFDRGGYLYHGRVKALADAARDGGLKF